MSATTLEQASSEEQSLISGLGKQVSAILDAHEIEPTISSDGTAIREITKPNGGKLIETITPEGGRSFSFSQPIVYMTPPDSGTETMVWKDSSQSSSVVYKFEGEETGTYNAALSNVEDMAQLEHKIQRAFPLPEKAPEKHPGKLKAFLGRLSFK